MEARRNCARTVRAVRSRGQSKRAFPQLRAEARKVARTYAGIVRGAATLPERGGDAPSAPHGVSAGLALLDRANGGGVRRKNGDGCPNIWGRTGKHA